jgi:hypothetical protein
MATNNVYLKGNFVMSQSIKRTAISTALICLLVASLTGCGTLTGLPGHGGGKRFATEQKLVAASVRATIMQLDVTPLKDKKVALVFDFMSDEGGGSIVGGRGALGMLISGAAVTSPVTGSTSAFQTFNLANQSTTGQTSGTTSTSTGTTTGTGSSTSSSDTTGTDTSTSNSSNTGTSTTNIGATSTTQTGSSNNSTTTGAVTTTNNLGGTSTSTVYPGSTTTTTTGATTTTQTTPGTTVVSTGAASTNTSTTGAVTTTGTGTSTGTSSTGASTNTQTSSGTGTSTNTGSSTSRNTGTGTSTSNQNSTGAGTQNTTGTANTTGTNQQVVASGQTSQTKGMEQRSQIDMVYRGLGDYQTLAVPKSDATFLMGQMRNYLMRSGVHVSTPQDQTIDAVLYVSVDVFGIVRSRFDVLAYNNELVKAETGIEIMAVDKKTGKTILSPRNANMEALYKEHYLFWMGPLESNKVVRQGEGLLVDFSQVDGSKKKYDVEKKTGMRVLPPYDEEILPTRD